MSSLSKPENEKNLPFKAEDFIEKLGESSKRSRQVLLILTFTSALILLAAVNSIVPPFNWFESKVNNHSSIHKTLYTRFDFSDSGKYQEQSLYQFILENESRNLRPDSSLAIEYLSSPYVTNNHTRLSKFTLTSKEKRKNEYAKIDVAMKYMSDKNLANRQQLQYHLNNLKRAELDHIDFVNVPFLGIAFHINYLGIYAGLILLILFYLLHYSLLSEYTNITVTIEYCIIGLKINQYYLYELLSMQQVLFRPRKLFSRHKPVHVIREGSKSEKFDFFKLAMLVPLVAYFGVILNDLFTIKTGWETNQPLTLICTLSNCFFAWYILKLFNKTWKRSSKIDYLWSNWAVENNLTFVLDKLGTVAENRDIATKFLNSTQEIVQDRMTLKVDDDIEKVKLFWHDSVKDMHVTEPKNKEESKKNVKMVMQGLETFTNNCLYDTETDLDHVSFIRSYSRTMNEPRKDDDINNFWTILVNWNNLSTIDKLYGSPRRLTDDIVKAKTTSGEEFD